MIPKDSNLIIAPYFMARDPKIWANPLKFIPERYEVETTAEKTNPYSYIPFSAGLKPSLRDMEQRFFGREQKLL